MTQALGLKELLAYGKMAIKLSDSLAIPKRKDGLDEKQELKLMKIIEQFILNNISYEQATSYFIKEFGTSNPIDQIKLILDEAKISQPIPNPFSFSNLQSKKVRHWTRREDNRLLAGVYLYGINDWHKIALFVGAGRGRPQCLQRWTRTLNPEITKDVWSKEEEEKLCNIVSQYNKVSWTKVAHLIGNRSDVQCRYHYEQIMKNNDRKKKENSQQPLSIAISQNQQAAVQPVNLYITSQPTTNLISLCPVIVSSQPQIINPVNYPPDYAKKYSSPMGVDAFLSCFGN